MTIPSASPDPAVRNDLLDAVRLIRVANGYIHVDGVPTSPLQTMHDDADRTLTDLATALYSRWYARWQPPAYGPYAGAEQPGIVPRVRTAHAATAFFDVGWVVNSFGFLGDIAVKRGGEELYLEKGDYVNLTRLAAPVRAGDHVAVTRRRDRSVPEEGWWYTWGSVGPPPALPLLRVYWNCGSEAAPIVVKAITTVMEQGAAPYMLKCPSHDALFGRCDSIVLYLSPQVWHSARQRLREAYQQVAKCLRPQAPRMALSLGPGVAIAEDPADGRSFGESRSRAVADGVIHVLLSGAAKTEDVVATMAARLPAHGISLSRPYLRAGSAPDTIDRW
jgi:hypothetical protein